MIQDNLPGEILIDPNTILKGVVVDLDFGYIHVFSLHPPVEAFRIYTKCRKFYIDFYL